MICLRDVRWTGVLRLVAFWLCWVASCFIFVEGVAIFESLADEGIPELLVGVPNNKKTS